MSLNTRSAQVVLSLLLGLIITGGLRAQGSFQPQMSFGIPNELRRFSVAANADQKIQDLPSTGPIRNPFGSDHFSIKDPPSVPDAFAGDPSAQPREGFGKIEGTIRGR